MQHYAYFHVYLILALIKSQWLDSFSGHLNSREKSLNIYCIEAGRAPGPMWLVVKRKGRTHDGN
jgi:hypothetical protein